MSPRGTLVDLRAMARHGDSFSFLRAAAALLVVTVLAGSPPAVAGGRSGGGTGPVQGWESVLSNIEEKGPTYGRCNALVRIGENLLRQGHSLPGVQAPRLASCAVYSACLSAGVTLPDTHIDNPPKPNDMTFTVREDELLTGTLRASDDEGGVFTYYLVDGTSLGETVLVNPVTGAFTFDNLPDRNGPDLFTYTAHDEQKGCDWLVGRVDIAITPVNDDPVLDPIANQTTDEGQALTGIPFTADEGGWADENAQNLTVTVTSGDSDLFPPANIRVHFADGPGDAAGGTIDLIPAGDFNTHGGPATITVAVKDDDDPQRSATRTFQVTVRPVNDPPTLSAIPDQGSDEDRALIGIPFTADEGGWTDEDAQAVTVTATSDNPVLLPAGSIQVHFADGGGDASGGTLDLTPAKDVNGTAHVTLTASDGLGLAATTTFTYVVGEVNDEPVLSSFADASTVEDGSFQTAFAADEGGWSDENLQTLSVTAVSSRTDIVASVGISFNDGAGDASSALGTLTVMPAPDAFGPVVITVTADDGGLQAKRQFTLDVRSVNDPPTIDTLGLSIETLEDTGSEPVSYRVDEGGGHWEDPQAVSVSATLDKPELGAVSFDPATGNGAADGLSGSLAFVPAPNANGTGKITFKVTDGDGAEQTATVDVNVIAVNDKPTLDLPAEYTIDEDTEGALIAMGYDEGGGSDEDEQIVGLTVASSDQKIIPDAGIALPDPDGTGDAVGGDLGLTPVLNVNGDTVLTVTANDGQLSESKEVTVHVIYVPDPPVWEGTDEDGNLVFDVEEDKTLAATVTITDPDRGDIHAFSVSRDPATTEGCVNCEEIETAELTKAGETDRFAAFTFRAVPDFPNSIDLGGREVAEVRFRLVVADNDFTVEVPVVVRVHPAPDPTIAEDGELNLDEDAIASGQIHAFDADIEPFTYRLITDGQIGHVDLHEDGSFNYIPDKDLFGPDYAVFSVSDGVHSDLSTFAFTVNPINDPPVVDDVRLSDSAFSGGKGIIDPNARDVDNWPEDLTLSIVDQPALGTVVVNGLTIEYTTTVTGGIGDVSYEVLAGGDFHIDLNGGSDDGSGIELLTDPEVGAATLDSSGTVTLVTGPHDNAVTGFDYSVPGAVGVSGQDTLTYQATDGLLSSDLGTATIDLESARGSGTVNLTIVATGVPDEFALKPRSQSIDGDPGDMIGSTVDVSGDYAVAGAPYVDNGRGAVYVFRRNGDNWSKVQELLPSNPQDSAHFGQSVAIDDDVIAVGQPGWANSRGAVYVFKRQASGNYNQVYRSDAPAYQDGSSFGGSVDIAKRRDYAGYILVAGQPSYDQSSLSYSCGNIYHYGYDSYYCRYYSGRYCWHYGYHCSYQTTYDYDVGRAHVFRLAASGGYVTSGIESIAPVSTTDYTNFGFSVSTDGVNVVVSQPFLGASGYPYAYFYRDYGTYLSRRAYFAGEYNSGAGTSVAVRGPYAAAGAVNNNSVAIWKTADDGYSWSYVQTIYGESSTDYGRSVDLSAGFLGVGAPYANGTEGRALLYPGASDGSGFLAGPDDVVTLDPNGDGALAYGAGVALDGDTAMVGAPYTAYSEVGYAGRVYFNSELTVPGDSAADDPPIALTGVFETKEERALLGQLDQKFAFDFDSASFTFQIVASTQHGTLEVLNSSKGRFVYTPEADYAGWDTFLMRVGDGGSWSDPAEIRINVVPVSDFPPVLITQATAWETPEDAYLSATLDVTADVGVPLTFTVDSPPAHGSFTTTEWPDFTYLPDPNYHGADSFTVTVFDGTYASDPQTYFLDVRSVNDIPRISGMDLNGNTASGTEDTAVDILLQAQDVDGEAVLFQLSDGYFHYQESMETLIGTVSLVETRYGNSHCSSLPGYGENDISCALYRFHPSPNLSGTANFLYRAVDPNGGASGYRSVEVTIAPADDGAPVILTTEVAALEDTSRTLYFQFGGIEMGESPGVSLVSGPPAGGSFSLSPAIQLIGGPGDPLNRIYQGSVTYLPPSNFFGNTSFRIQVNDGFGNLVQGEISIDVEGVNDAPGIPRLTAGNPCAYPNTGLCPEDGQSAAFPLAATDVDGDIPGFVLYNSPGTLTGSEADGQTVWTYRAEADWNGYRTLYIKAFDGELYSSSYLALQIRIDPVDDGPAYARDLEITLDEEELHGYYDLGYLLASRYPDVNDPPGNGMNSSYVELGETNSFALVTPPAHNLWTTLYMGAIGTSVGSSGWGAGWFSYQGDENFHGTDSFVYSISDGYTTTTATVTIHVLPVEDTPVTAWYPISKLMSSSTYGNNFWDGYLYEFQYYQDKGETPVHRISCLDPIVDGFPAAGDVPCAYDPDGHAVEFTYGPSYSSYPEGIYTTYRGGTVDFRKDGTFAYTPPGQDWEGQDWFEYAVRDSESPASGYSGGNYYSNQAGGSVRITVGEPYYGPYGALFNYTHVRGSTWGDNFDWWKEELYAGGEFRNPVNLHRKGGTLLVNYLSPAVGVHRFESCGRLPCRTQLVLKQVIQAPDGITSSQGYPDESAYQAAFLSEDERLFVAHSGSADGHRGMQGVYELDDTSGQFELTATLSQTDFGAEHGMPDVRSTAVFAQGGRIFITRRVDNARAAAYPVRHFVYERSGGTWIPHSVLYEEDLGNTVFGNIGFLNGRPGRLSGRFANHEDHLVDSGLALHYWPEGDCGKVGVYAVSASTGLWELKATTVLNGPAGCSAWDPGFSDGGGWDFVKAFDGTTGRIASRHEITWEKAISGQQGTTYVRGQLSRYTIGSDYRVKYWGESWHEPDIDPNHSNYSTNQRSYKWLYEDGRYVKNDHYGEVVSLLGKLALITSPGASADSYYIGGPQRLGVAEISLIGDPGDPNDRWGKAGDNQQKYAHLATQYAQGPFPWQFCLDDGGSYGWGNLGLMTSTHAVVGATSSPACYLENGGLIQSGAYPGTWRKRDTGSLYIFDGYPNVFTFSNQDWYYRPGLKQ